MKINNKRGFTLIEVLVVVVILGVLAGLALPVYQGQVEKSRAAEALAQLDAMRSSMIRYFSQNGTYATATLGAGAATDLDYNPNVGQAGQTILFTYTIQAQAAGTFTLRARRTALAATDFIEINQAGTVVRSGVYL